MVIKQVHIPMVLDAGTALESVPLLSCVGFVLSLHREVGSVR